MSSHSKRPQKKNRLAWLIPALFALLLFLGDMAVEVLGDTLKEMTQPYRKWVWGALVIAALIAVIIAITEARKSDDESESAGNNSSNNQGVITIGDNAQNNRVTSQVENVGSQQIQGGKADRDVINNFYQSASPVTNFLHQLPPPPRGFVGRKKEIEELTKALEKGGVTISGLQGLKIFDLERENIESGYEWTETFIEKSAEVTQLAMQYFDAGVYVLGLRLHSHEMKRWLETMVKAARLLKDKGREGNALGNLGIAYKNLGEPRKAIEFYEQHLVITQEIGDRRGEGADLGNLGNAYADLGEPRKAIEFHEKQLVITQEIGDRRGEGITLWNKALAYKKLGERPKAILLGEKSLEIYEQVEHPNRYKNREILENWKTESE